MNDLLATEVRPIVRSPRALARKATPIEVFADALEITMRSAPKSALSRRKSSMVNEVKKSGYKSIWRSSVDELQVASLEVRRSVLYAVCR